MRHAGAHDGAVPSNEPPLATLLADAISDAGLNVTQLARRLAASHGTKMESKRRLLQKYLKGPTVPDEPQARQLAQELGKPDDYFVTSKALPPRRGMTEVWEQIDEIRGLIDELQRRVAGRDAGQAPPQSGAGRS